jgi:hypothetical protein
MKKLILTLCAASLIGAIKAQTTLDTAKTWTKSSEFGTNAALSGTSPNWSGGASNNLSGNVFFNALAKGKWNNSSWDNVLKINIGAISSTLKDVNATKYRSTKKNIDNVFFDSKYGYKFKNPKWLGAYAGINIQTQLLSGYAYKKSILGRDSALKTSSFMSQGTTMPSIGLEAKPVNWAFIRLGLGALKQTWVINQSLYRDGNPNLKYLDDANKTKTLYGVEEGQYIRNEIGFNIQAGLDKSFGPEKMYNVKVNYLGFAPYSFTTSNSPLDSRFDVGMSAKVGKYMNLNYTLIFYI